MGPCGQAPKAGLRAATARARGNGVVRGWAACLGVAAALLCACSGAPLPTEPRPRPTRRVPPSPVRATTSAETTEGFVALVTPSFDRIRIPAGTFMMGSSQSEVSLAQQACLAELLGDPEICEKREYSNEMWEHDVFVRAFFLDRTEVTVERYRACVSTGVCPELPYASGGARFDAPDLPVVLVTWSEARRFCRWAEGRLPTEAEWERAARGTEGRRYPWGNVYNAFLTNHGRLAWDELDDSDGFLEVAPVGSFPDGATRDGVLDLAGNVEEWVADWYAPAYEAASVMNPQGPKSGDERVVRGGSFAHLRANLRGASRGHALAEEKRTWRGFRCAYDAK